MPDGGDRGSGGGGRIVDGVRTGTEAGIDTRYRTNHGLTSAMRRWDCTIFIASRPLIPVAFTSAKAEMSPERLSPMWQLTSTLRPRRR